MIEQIQSFCAVCDNCNKDYEHHHEGWTIFNDKSRLMECMSDSGWAIGAHYEGAPKDKVYCPDCFTVNDNDEFIIKTI
jgi:hypothetical protein